MAETIKVCDRYEYQSPTAVVSRPDWKTGGVKYETKYAPVQKTWFCKELPYYDEARALKNLEDGKKKFVRDQTELKFVRWTRERKWFFSRSQVTGEGKTPSEAWNNLIHWENRIAILEKNFPR